MYKASQCFLNVLVFVLNAIDNKIVFHGSTLQVYYFFFRLLTIIRSRRNLFILTHIDWMSFFHISEHPTEVYRSSGPTYPLTRIKMLQLNSLCRNSVEIRLDPGYAIVLLNLMHRSRNKCYGIFKLTCSFFNIRHTLILFPSHHLQYVSTWSQFYRVFVSLVMIILFRCNWSRMSSSCSHFAPCNGLVPSGAPYKTSLRFINHREWLKFFKKLALCPTQSPVSNHT